MSIESMQVTRPEDPAVVAGGDPRQSQGALHLVGVVHGPPRDPHTWSGISASLFRALEHHCVIDDLVDCGPGRVATRAAQVASFSPVRSRWRAKYSVSPVASTAMRRRAARVLEHSVGRTDAVLQAGSWYDLTGLGDFRPRVRAAYLDADVALFSRRPDLPVDASQRWARRRRRHEQRVYDHLDLVFTFSTWLARSLVEDFGQPQEKVHAVGAGANIAELPGPVVRDWTRPRFLFVGKKWERKGGPELLEAFRAVRALRPDAELWIVGPEAPPALDPGIRFHGFVSTATPGGRARLDRLYREATAFVMPSRFEPFGIVFLEAMAYGLPCIGTDACAMPEIISEGASGHLAPPGDTDALAARMVGLADDPDRAARLGETGRLRMESQFRWQHVADRMVGAIRACLDETA